MGSTVEKINALTYKLNVIVPVDEVNNAVQIRIQKLAKTVDMKGFRKGKVPEDVIESRFGTGVLQEVSGELIQSSFEKAIEEHKLRLAGMPKVEPQPFKKGNPLVYEAIVEVLPEVILKDLEGVTIEKTVAEIRDSDVDHVLENMRKQHADWETVERASQEGDRLIFDFEGSINGEKFEGGSAKEFQLVLGSKQMIPGFEEGLMGLKAGDSKDLHVTFPEQYPAENLKAKEAVFAIKVHKVEQPKLPALDDAFAKKLGVKEGLEALKADVRKKMTTELEQSLQHSLKTKVIDKLVELNPIETPESLIEQEIEHLQSLARQEIAMYQGKEKADEMLLSKEPYVEQAKRRVIVGLLLAEAVKTYAIHVDRDKVKEHVELLAASYSKPEELVAWYYKNPRMMSEIEAIVLENQVIDRLLEKASVKEKSESYEDVINS